MASNTVACGWSQVRFKFPAPSKKIFSKIKSSNNKESAGKFKKKRKKTEENVCIGY